MDATFDQHEAKKRPFAQAGPIKLPRPPAGEAGTLPAGLHGSAAFLKRIFGSSGALLGFTLFLLFFGINYEFLRIARLNYLYDPDNILGKFAQNQISLTPDQFKERLMESRETVRYLPYKALAYGNLGFCYFYAKDVPRAIHAYRRAIAEEPNWYHLYFDLALIYYDRRDYIQAAKFLEQSLSIIPKTRGLFREVTLFLNQNQNPFFIEMVQYLNRIDQDEPTLWLILGETYYHQKRIQEFLKISQEGSRLFPGQARFRFHLAIGYFLLEKWADAKVSIDAAIAQYPGQSEFYSLRGMIQQKLTGENSIEDFQKAFILSGQGKHSTAFFPTPPRLHYFPADWLFKVYSQTGFIK